MLTHLFSQPLPHYLSYFIHNLVVRFNLSYVLTMGVFLFELFVPFGLLFPAYRRISAMALIFFQVLIMLTGNFGYFNLLVIVGLIPFLWLKKSSYVAASFKRTSWIFAGALFFVLYFSIQTMVSGHRFHMLQRLSLFNNYGLFATITDEQMRYQIYVSHDNHTWDSVQLKYFNPQGFPNLEVLIPYLPRIRWRLWFHFISPNGFDYWYQQFLEKLAFDPVSVTSMVTQNQIYLTMHTHHIQIIANKHLHKMAIKLI